MSKVRIAVIGAGSISEMHLKSYQNNPDAELYAICDLNEERAKAKAEKYGITRIYTDYKELLADPGVDAVSICTWNNSHAPISIAALDAGKNVLTEKPLCKTVGEALAVEEAVHRSGKTLQVGFVLADMHLTHVSLNRFWKTTNSVKFTTPKLRAFVVSVTRVAGFPMLSVRVAVH